MSRKISVILISGIILLISTSSFITEGSGQLKINRYQNNIIKFLGGVRNELAYYPELHDFANMHAGDIDNTTFEIWNGCGCGTLFYNLTWDCSWVDVYPTTGSSIGEHDTINVDINTTGLLPGLHICEISILSSGGNGIFIVKVNIVAKLKVGGNGPGNYSLIQDAIDNASDGDTIFVYDDSSPYYENIFIEKMINLIGEDKNTTMIDGKGTGDVIKISADNVVISGFNIQNSGNSYAGINVISNNNILDNNIINNNWYGIYLEYCSNNIISNNNICYQTDTGLRTKYANNNTISGNNVSSNEGYGICHKFVSSYNNIMDNIISSNIEGNIDVSYQSCHNNISKNLISSSDSIGIDIYQQSCYNIIFNNNIYLNNFKGISFTYLSNNNIIYYNNFLNNTQNSYDECTNIWDNGYPTGGNYWSDYTGIDIYKGPDQNIIGNDGIGDIPYEIPGDSNKDNYPLIFIFGENPPVANFIYFINDLSILVDASLSYDRDGEIISYEWDFGDGGPGTGKITGHTYSEGGTYTVTLNITDDDNLTDTISQNVTTEDTSPPLIINLQAIPPIQSPGGFVNISAIVRDDDVLENVCLIIKYPDESIKNISIFDNKIMDLYYYNQTYDMIGAYYCYIWAVDISGNNVNSSIINFEITQDFTANAGGPYFGYEETPLQFYGYNINGFPPFHWNWDFGDGNTADEQNPIHIYENSGNYTVTLTVTDDEDSTASDTTWALIDNINHPPEKPTITGSTSGKPGIIYTYCIEAYDPDDDNMYVLWDWGDGETSNWLGPFESGVRICESHTWDLKGDYLIQVTLKDEHEVSVTGSLSITMPRYKMFNIKFLQFLSNYLNIFPKLYYFLQLPLQ